MNEKIEIDKYCEWTCLCGNVASDSGFAPVNEHNEVVEPDLTWTTFNYGCLGCGRIINGDSAMVVARVHPSTLVEDYIF